MTLRPAALSLLAAVLTGAVFVAPAAAQSSCAWYTREALRQQQDNIRGHCGFQGPSWSSDMKAHAAWCATARPDDWRAEARKREQMLATCKK